MLIPLTSVVLDVETTGLGHASYYPRKDAVVQLGAAWREQGTVKTWSSHCNPGREYLQGGRAEEALRINGITHQTILTAKPAATVAQDFRELMQEVEESTGEATFLAYNRDFDEGFLKQPPWSIPASKWGPCIMRAAAHQLTGRDRLKLERATQMLGITMPGTAHDAANDAHAALLVHETLQKQAKH